MCEPPQADTDLMVQHSVVGNECKQQDIRGSLTD